MPTFADANRASLRYVPETEWGVLPSTTATISTEIRLTSSSLAANKETVVSDELRADRMVSSVPEVGATSSGDINFELSAGSHDDFLKAFLQGEWTRPFLNFYDQKGTQVYIDTTSTIVITGVDATSYFKAGDIIRLTGFTTQANNNYFDVSIDSTFGSGNTTITVTGTPLTTESGSAYTRIQQCDDVVIDKSTSIDTDTAANRFTGTGVFTNAINADELVEGMVIHVDGLGYEAGTVTVATAAAVDAEKVTVDDGVNSAIIFEFDTGDGVTAGNISVASGASLGDSATNLANAIMNQYHLGNLNCTAAATAGAVDIRNLNKTGGTLAVADTTNVSLTTQFTGGDAAASGFFTITEVNANYLAVTPDPQGGGAGVASGDAVTVKACMVRNPNNEDTGKPWGDIVSQSFSIETSYNDITQHFLQKGMRVGTYSLDLSTGAIVTGTMSFNGKDTVRSTTDALNGGGTAFDIRGTTTTEVMNATSNVGSIKKDGSTLSTKLSALSLSGDNSLRDQNAIGSKFPEGIGVGRFNLTGSITAYFENGNLYDEFINHDTVALSWQFTDLDNNVYVYTIPAVKFTSDPVAPGGIDQDVFEEIEWTAFRDATTKCMLQVDRFSDTSPLETS